GRHDPVIVPRAVVVVESMTAITVLDMLFSSMTSKMDNIIKFFE
ncbi:MAG: chorismate synthase, partial [Eubacterium sp.]